jgi:heterodisulfide reductase subunit A-like polyferredoxin
MMTMLDRIPWVDTTKCDITQRCEGCKAARLCPHGAFSVVNSEGACRVFIDLEACKRCGECAHACELGAVRMI